MRVGMSMGLLLVLAFQVALAHGHTAEDLKKEFGEVPEGLKRITATYEKASREAYQPNPDLEPYQREAAMAHWKSLLSQLHSAQHEMLSEHQKSLLLTKCLEMLKKIPAAERRLQKLEKAGKDTEAEHQVLDEAKAFASINCSQVPK